MARKLIKQSYFVPKELRLSIAIIILWSLLVTAFFTFFVRELGEKMGNNALLFVVIMLGYLIIVIVLTMLFSHRLTGPFQRLMTEMRLIRSGDYHRRLHVRISDDIYIRSFVEEVNRILDDFEKVQMNKQALVKHLDSELMSMMLLIEDEDVSKSRHNESVPEFQKRLRSSAEKQQAI